MERIGNDYCWNTVKDWREAQKMGFVNLRDFLSGSSEENLRSLVELALNNCFPLQMVCIGTSGEKYIMASSLMRKFLQFINNEIPMICTDKKKMFFEELPEEEQNKILEAQMDSVWINMGL